ncbi:MAG: TonB-dependent siderophore receptor [Verrucomicrobiota bacterium]
MKQDHPSTPSTLRSFSRTEAFAMTGTLLALGQFAAHAAPEPEKKKDDTTDSATTLPRMVVEADSNKPLYNPRNLETPKFTVPLVDVPQTVTVVPQEVIKEQGVTNLRDVLKNVPGISITAGEGGAPPGDNLSIRGFPARSDLFVDGVRDFGSYSRDPFNVEQVEVYKGPSSTNFGRGSTGGSINLATKTPHMGDSYQGSLTAGTDDLGRATVDVNQEIPQLSGTAVRLNAMLHSQDVADRDQVEQKRWGIAPSISFGLGTDTRLTLSYFHLQQDNVPDYGNPWVTQDNPTTPDNENIYGISSGALPSEYFDNWYGLTFRDYEKTNTDIITAVFEHDFNESLKLRNVARYGRNHIDFSVTAPRFAYSLTTPPPPGASVTDIRRSDWKNRDQVDEIAANQLSLQYDFKTGVVEHELVTAVDYSYEHSTTRGRDDLNIATAPNTDLFNPNPDDRYVRNVVYNGVDTDADVHTFGASVFDTAKLNEQWSLSGGGRFDYFDTSVSGVNRDRVTLVTTPFDLSADDEVFSYRGAVTYKPLPNGSVYLGYGTSFNPVGAGDTAVTLSDDPTSTSNLNLNPEENATVELGTKWEFMDEKLLVSGAVFQTTKTDARTIDPVTGVAETTGEQEVKGFEIGATGLITENWRIIGGYTFLDSEVTESGNVFEEGNEIAQTPENSASLWTVHDLPAGFQVGLGASYVGARFNSSDETRRQRAPGYTTFDGLIGYTLNENVSFRLNGYNLFDKEYIDRVGGGHYVPGAGRTIALSADFKF